MDIGLKGGGGNITVRSRGKLRRLAFGASYPRVTYKEKGMEELTSVCARGKRKGITVNEKHKERYLGLHLWSVSLSHTKDRQSQSVNIIIIRLGGEGWRKVGRRH